MSSKTDTGLKSILAPLSGQTVPLEQVPDDVFFQKILLFENCVNAFI